MNEKYVHTIENMRNTAMTQGAGIAGAHTPVTDAGWEGEYAYMIEMYTDGVKFDILEEDGATVSDLRKSIGATGYPKGAKITGRFTKIKPASGAIVGAFLYSL